MYKNRMEKERNKDLALAHDYMCNVRYMGEDEWQQLMVEIKDDDQLFDTLDNLYPNWQTEASTHRIL